MCIASNFGNMCSHYYQTFLWTKKEKDQFYGPVWGQSWIYFSSYGPIVNACQSQERDPHLTKRTPNPCKASSGMTKTSLGIPSCIFLPWSLPNPENHWTSSTSPLRVPETKGHVSVTNSNHFTMHSVYLCIQSAVKSVSCIRRKQNASWNNGAQASRRGSTDFHLFFHTKTPSDWSTCSGKGRGISGAPPQSSPPHELATREVLPTFERKPTEKNSSVSIRFHHLSEVNRPQMIPTSEVSTNSPAGLHSSRNPHLAQRSPVIFHDAEAEESWWWPISWCA